MNKSTVLLSFKIFNLFEVLLKPKFVQMRFVFSTRKGPWTTWYQDHATQICKKSQQRNSTRRTLRLRSSQVYFRRMCSSHSECETSRLLTELHECHGKMFYPHERSAACYKYGSEVLNIERERHTTPLILGQHIMKWWINISPGKVRIFLIWGQPQLIFFPVFEDFDQTSSGVISFFFFCKYLKHGVGRRLSGAYL